MPNATESAVNASVPPQGAAPGPVHVLADVAALTDRGKTRDNNEDSYVVFRMGRYLERVSSSIPEAELPSRFEDAGHLMIVADGLGGHVGGEVASRSALVTALQLILRSPRWALKLDDAATREREIEELLVRSRGYLARVHTALQEKAAGDASLVGMGTTLTGAYSVGRDVFVLHVGDSKAYLFRDGVMTRVTRDHTVAQAYADRGMIAQDEVPGHRLAHVLTRAIGGPEDQLEGDMHHLEIRHGDRVLLCSDGLTDMVTDADIAATLAAHPASEAACRALVDLALERGGRDNVTVIVAGYSLA